MTKDEALKLALEALTNAYWPTESDLMPAHNIKECAEAITAIKEALAQPEQEPVIDKSAAVRIATSLGWEPKRTWVGLTDEEVNKLVDDEDWYNDPHEFSRIVEAKVRGKNDAS